MRRSHLLTAIRIFSVVFLAGLFCFFTLALRTKAITDDLWKQLGLLQTEANIYIKYSTINGSLQYFGAKNAKNILAGDRVAVINELFAYAKKYVASDEFRRAYENERKLNKPADQVTFGGSADSIRAAEKKRINEAIKQTEANANNPNPKIKNAVPLRLENLRKELAAVDDPNNKIIQAKLNQLQQMNNSLASQYNDAMKKFEMKYPENPQVLIKARLQEILIITADVDYKAELQQVGKWMKFVNPDYEKKPKEWKLAFRAGKPATDAVRALAEKWLKEFK